MAKPCTRTYCDDVADALELLDAAQRELANWRAHLNALQTDPNYGRARQANRSASIVIAAVTKAACHTHNTGLALWPPPEGVTP